MIGVFPQLDGISFALFHVEQREDPADPVRVRWRMVDPDLPPPYRVWQTVEFRDRLKLVQPARALSSVEVEWFDPSAGSYGEWRQAALLLLTRGSARFSVRAMVDLDVPKGFTAVAPVPPFGVASFVFPALHLAAGMDCVVSARQEGICLANLLLEPGVFLPRDPHVEIANLSASVGAWKELPPGPVTLSRVADVPANYFAFAGERIPVPQPSPTS